jgi:hypothetical protein
VLVARMDLSFAFNVVNVDLLLKRMNIIGLPNDVIELVKICLSDRFYYVSVGGEISCLFDKLLCTLQGIVLGPVLYAIYVSPLFVLIKFIVIIVKEITPTIKLIQNRGWYR